MCLQDDMCNLESYGSLVLCYLVLEFVVLVSTQNITRFGAQLRDGDSLRLAPLQPLVRRDVYHWLASSCMLTDSDGVQSQQGSASHSFLLDDDSSNPFNANEVQISMNDKELYSEMPIPEQLKENKAFEFLSRDLKLTSVAQPPAQ